MKKENIYKLVELGYKGGEEYNLYVSEFIKNLDNEKYFEMADFLRELQFKNSKISFSSIDNKKMLKDNFLLTKNLKQKMIMIENGYKKGLINNVLLIGKPGTGKTSFVEYLSKKLDLALVNIRISDILDYKYGQSIRKLEEIMNLYKEQECILFFDEADSLFRKRGRMNDVFETDRIVSTMLKELDKEFKPITIFASNLFNELDQAIIRRMDEIINFNDYDVKTLIDIWKYNMKKFKLMLDEINISKMWDFINQNSKTITPSDLRCIAKKIAILQLYDSYIEIELVLDNYYDFRNESLTYEK